MTCSGTTSIGIDVGGTKIQGVAVEGGEVAADAKVATPTGGVDDVVAAIVTCVGRLGASSSAPVGVGAAGVVETRTGTLVQAPNLAGFDGPVPLGPLLAEALGAEVTVDNDANAAVLAEHLMGAGRGSDDLLGVWIGTGIGGGLVLDGRLRRGPGGGAGEIGHMSLVGSDRICPCGMVGHLEAVAGRAAMEAEARRRHATGTPTLMVELAGDKRMKSSVFAKALAAGDVVVSDLLDEAVGALGSVIASAATLLDLDRVVVGGGLAEKLGPSFVGRIEQAVRCRLFVRASSLRVIPTELGDLAGALGAARLPEG
ncbi:MAG TPA: ROK family protein [Acidimicrobiales bacterium]|nr:ROK family protein [Acidimicrobiales bacterium]